MKITLRLLEAFEKDQVLLRLDELGFNDDKKLQNGLTFLDYKNKYLFFREKLKLSIHNGFADLLDNKLLNNIWNNYNAIINYRQNGTNIFPVIDSFCQMLITYGLVNSLMKESNLTELVTKITTYDDILAKSAIKLNENQNKLNEVQNILDSSNSALIDSNKLLVEFNKLKEDYKSTAEELHTAKTIAKEYKDSLDKYEQDSKKANIEIQSILEFIKSEQDILDSKIQNFIKKEEEIKTLIDKAKERMCRN